MEVIHQCVGGLDVHKKTVMACRRRLLGDGQVESEVLEFRTSTLGLYALSKWLSEWGCTHVAMELTGVLWIPVWNVLEADFKLLLTNAQQLKKVPGRKRDVGDAEWIAQLMQCGLLKPSLVLATRNTLRVMLGRISPAFWSLYKSSELVSGLC